MIPSGSCEQPTNGVSTGNPMTGGFACTAICMHKDIFTRYYETNFDCLGTPGINKIAGTPKSTVCTNMKPFKIGVHTDGVEYAHPAGAAENFEPNNAGFRINYFMKTACIWYKEVIV